MNITHCSSAENVFNSAGTSLADAVPGAIAVAAEYRFAGRDAVIKTPAAEFDCLPKPGAGVGSFCAGAAGMWSFVWRFVAPCCAGGVEGLARRRRIFCWDRERSGIFGHAGSRSEMADSRFEISTESAPHPSPLAPPVRSARDGAALAAWGEGMRCLRAWCLYL